MPQMERKQYRVTVTEIYYYDDTRENSARTYVGEDRQEIFRQEFDDLDLKEIARFLNKEKSS